jgi:hypothetical protein
MVQIVDRLRWSCLAFSGALFMIGALNVVPLFGQSLAQSPPDFFVQLGDSKTDFYASESIQFGVNRRTAKKSGSGCTFGFQGKIQVLRNGEVIKEWQSGVLSRLASGNINGVSYNGFGSAITTSYFVSGHEIDIKDSYQIRATCGDEISEPSSVFHINPWLEPVDGLQVFLRPVQKVYKVGQPILVEATMRNVGTKPLICPIPHVDDGHRRGFWRLDRYWEDPRPQFEDSIFYARRLGMINPGESRTAIIDLSVYRAPGIDGKPSFGSRSGEYQFALTVFFHDENESIPKEYRKNLWRGELGTNTIEVIVRDL